MKAFLNFISALNKNPPAVFGAAHILLMVFTLAAIVCVCALMRKTGNKALKFILIAAGSWLLLFEVFKQAVLIYDSGNYNYNWHHLPLQPCSALMYSMFAAGIMTEAKNKKVKAVCDFLLCFVAVYGFFSGMSAVVLPGAIFTETYLFLIFQSMQHHIILALIAVYLFANNRVKLCFKSFLKALSVFGAFCAFALVLNLIFYAAFKNSGINLMYMGPFKIWEIPLISGLLNINHYAVFLPLYLIGYSGAALAAEYICRGVKHAFCNIMKKNKGIS